MHISCVILTYEHFKMDTQTANHIRERFYNVRTVLNSTCRILCKQLSNLPSHALPRHKNYNTNNKRNTKKHSVRAFTHGTDTSSLALTF